MGSFKAEIDEGALEFLADVAGGDARQALNAVELGVLTTQRSEDGLIHLTLEVASECIQSGWYTTIRLVTTIMIQSQLL